VSRMELIFAKIQDSGVPTGTAARDAAGVRRLFERGYQFATVNAGTLLADSARMLLEQARI